MFGKLGPIVTTKAGKNKGIFCVNTTYTFQGLSLQMQKDFRCRQEIQPWDGIKLLLLMVMYVHCYRMFPTGGIVVPLRYRPYGCTLSVFDVLGRRRLDTWQKNRKWYGFMEGDSTQELLSNR